MKNSYHKKTKKLSRCVTCPLGSCNQRTRYFASNCFRAAAIIDYKLPLDAHYAITASYHTIHTFQARQKLVILQIMPLEHPLTGGRTAHQSQMSSSKSSSEKTNLNPKVPVATKEPKSQPTKTLEEIDTNVNWQIAKGTPSTTEFSVRKSFEVEIASSKETEAAVVVDSVVATSTDAQEVVP